MRNVQNTVKTTVKPQKCQTLARIDSHVCHLHTPSTLRGQAHNRHLSFLMPTPNHSPYALVCIPQAPSVAAPSPLSLKEICVCLTRWRGRVDVAQSGGV